MGASTRANGDAVNLTRRIAGREPAAHFASDPGRVAPARSPGRLPYRTEGNMSGTLTYSARPAAHKVTLVVAGVAPGRQVAVAPWAVAGFPKCTQLGPDPEPLGLRFAALAERR